MGVIPDRFAVFTVDPGGVSGAACGVFEPAGEPVSLAETLRLASRHGEVEAWEVHGPPEVQAWEIAPEIAARVFEWTVERGIAYKDIHIVFETFRLRQRNVELAPIAVTAGCMTLLLPRSEMMSADGWGGAILGGVGVYQQEPADAKNFATGDRLKLWGLYGLGRGGGDHKRDALRHLALRVNKVLG